MKKLLMALVALAAAFTLAFGFAACVEMTPESTESSESTVEYSAPVITVEPSTLEIYQGGEVELLYGVTVTDEYDENITALVIDDDGFDADVTGTYTITYKAENSKGVSSTATRTIIVNEPLPNLVLEVQKANDPKWTGGVYMYFANELFVTLTEDTTYTDYNRGVFYNASDDMIVLDMPGGGGQAFITDTHGTVIEGRDGSNGYLMDKDHPQRVGSTARNFEYGGEEYAVASNFARFLQIPAKGFAVVVTNGMFGDGFDYDGRSFINKNAVYQYGVAVSIYWEGSDTTLTNYVDRGPSVNPPSALEIPTNYVTIESINESVISGLTITDDNGTFNVEDDIKTGFTVTVVSDGGCDPNVAGVYTYTLSVSDTNNNTTVFTRQVKLIDAAFSEISIGDLTFKALTEKIAIDKELTATQAGSGAYAFIIYTPAYTGEVNLNGWGIAVVLDKSFKVNRVYNGTSAKYYDAENDGTAASGWTSGTYAHDAFASRQAGETILIAPNGGDNNGATGSRSFLNNVKSAYIGAEFRLPGVTTGVVTVNGNTMEVDLNTIVINETATYSKVNFVVYNKTFTGTVNANGYGEAFVMDRFGTIVRIYDGANGRYRDADNPNGIADSNIMTASNYLVSAFNSLADGETLLCAPNGGLNSNAARAFLLNNRSIGATVTIPGVAFEKTLIAIDGTETEIVRGRLAVNKVLTAYTAYDYVVWDYNFKTEHATITNQGWGEAIIIDAATGEILRGYDGISAKYYDADNTQGSTTGCTAGNYITEAYASLSEGEIMIVGVNNGGSQAGRAVIAGYVKKIGSTVTTTNVL